MAASRTAATIRQRVKRLLNEANDTPAGQLESGTSTTATLATDAFIDDACTKAAQEITRTCYPLQGQFTVTIAAADLRLVSYEEFAPVTSGINPATPTGAELWQVLEGGVYLGSTRIKRAGEEELYRYDPDYVTTASAATPTYYYERGGAGIGLYPRVSGSSGTLTAHGLFKHPAIATSNTAFPRLPDDVVDFLEYFAAAMVAMKNMDNPVLYQRADQWLGQYEAFRAREWGRIDPLFKGYFPPLVPTIDAGGAGESILGPGRR